ncbi:hypothetical protein BDA99DRAFT_566576 [Phascolomyces articulosus]|uniref:C5a peptidase/Subtilisin-like protease SBT2-like Fn3-like domain-containing protein n=1 Tax=Phascolomyces articulosus TaxID=60185 RepID=A0AAD5P6S3_9FUNG|nr:hypothetical protein BDA99DRAFT_566576 [Phascolomyces articulosus]
MGSWQTINGTSMSAPYFSGSFALYLKAMRDDTQQQKQTPAYMLEQFQNHASKVPSWNFKDVYLSPFVQSAGLVQVHDAIHQKTHVTPATISFNDTANLVNTRTVTITNNGDFTVEYDIVNHRSESILPYVRDSYVFTKQIQYINNMTAHIEFPYEAIRLLPGQYIDVNLTITPPDADPSLHLMYGGFILFKDRSANKKDLTVPYIGIVGDQRELPVFAPNLPAVAGSDGNFISKAQTIVYDQKDENTAPFIVFSFATPTKRVNFELYDSVNNKLVGYVLPSTDFLPRPTYTEDDPSADQSSFQWTGTYFNSSIRDPKATPSQVSQGSYYIVISALKLLGDPNNSQDWESWRSNIIQVI